jgi:hypothetical protein
MTPSRKSFTAAAIVLSLAAANAVPAAFGQDQSKSLKEQLGGTWSLTELQAITWNGDDRQPFGPAPKGRMIFDRNGNVTCVIVGADRSKFVMADRLSGTPAENKAAVHSTQAFYGTYSINEDNRTIVFHVERSSFPNWDGTFQMSEIKISGNKLHQTKAGPHSSWGYAVWERDVERTISLTD